MTQFGLERLRLLLMELVRGDATFEDVEMTMQEIHDDPLRWGGGVPPPAPWSEPSVSPGD